MNVKECFIKQVMLMFSFQLYTFTKYCVISDKAFMQAFIIYPTVDPNTYFAKAICVYQFKI